jgi:hypothetical protein
MSTNSNPEKSKAAGALVIAPLLPVGILFALDGFSRAQQDGPLAIVGAAMLAVYMLVIVEILSITLGSLAISLLWGRIPFNIVVCVIAGGLVAALPFLVFGLIFAAGEPINYDAWVDGQATVVNGVKTAYGRWRDFLAILQIFGLGMIGGGFFWWLCRPKKSADIE